MNAERFTDVREQSDAEEKQKKWNKYHRKNGEGQCIYKGHGDGDRQEEICYLNASNNNIS